MDHFATAKNYAASMEAEAADNPKEFYRTGAGTKRALAAIDELRALELRFQKFVRA